MKIKDLQEIIDLVDNSGLTELSIEEENLKLTLKRESFKYLEASTQIPKQQLPSQAIQTEVHAKENQPEDNSFYIKSPTIGTFYASSSPDSEAYVTIGSVVEENTVVCILEAMKVMNEIRAECHGTILEILAENGSPVEYGQPLFRIKSN